MESLPIESTGRGPSLAACDFMECQCGIRVRLC